MGNQASTISDVKEALTQHAMCANVASVNDGKLTIDCSNPNSVAGQTTSPNNNNGGNGNVQSSESPLNLCTVMGGAAGGNQEQQHDYQTGAGGMHGGGATMGTSGAAGGGGGTIGDCTSSVANTEFTTGSGATNEFTSFRDVAAKAAAAGGGAGGGGPGGTNNQKNNNNNGSNHRTTPASSVASGALERERNRVGPFILPENPYVDAIKDLTFMGKPSIPRTNNKRTAPVSTQAAVASTRVVQPGGLPATPMTMGGGDDNNDASTTNSVGTNSNTASAAAAPGITGQQNSRGNATSSLPPNAMSENRAQFANRRGEGIDGPYTVTIGLCLSRRHTSVGHPDTVTRQTAFDFNELQDRTYKFVSSTDAWGWRAGGGESGALQPTDGAAAVSSGLSAATSPTSSGGQHKVASPDTVHIPIIQIDAESPQAIDAIVAALARGEVFIPHMSIMPELLSVNGVSPPDLVVRFGCERNEDIAPSEWPNWCLEFMHNQLFDFFQSSGARWSKRPFQITLAKKVRWRTVKHMNKYFSQSEKVINAWRERGPQFLDPQLSYIEGGATPAEVSRPHGIYLIRNGRPTNYFPPNFEPPYNTKIAKNLLMNVIGKSWDRRRRDWSSEPNLNITAANKLIGAVLSCNGPDLCVDQKFRPGMNMSDGDNLGVRGVPAAPAGPVGGIVATSSPGSREAAKTVQDDGTVAISVYSDARTQEASVAPSMHTAQSPAPSHAPGPVPEEQHLESRNDSPRDTVMDGGEAPRSPSDQNNLQQQRQGRGEAGDEERSPGAASSGSLSFAANDGERMERKSAVAPSNLSTRSRLDEVLSERGLDGEKAEQLKEKLAVLITKVVDNAESGEKASREAAEKSPGKGKKKKKNKEKKKDETRRFEFSTNQTSTNKAKKKSSKGIPPSQSESPVSLVYSLDSAYVDGRKSFSDATMESNSIAVAPSLSSAASESTDVDKGKSAKKKKGKRGSSKQKENNGSGPIAILPSTSSLEPMPTDEELFAVGWAKALDTKSGCYYYFTLDRSRTVWENPLSTGIYSPTSQ